MEKGAALDDWLASRHIRSARVAVQDDDPWDPEVLEIRGRDGSRSMLRTAGRPDAAPLLILDGIGCSGWAFRKMIPPLTQRFRVVLLHYRGHGQSPLPERPWALGMHDLADDAAEAIRSLGLVQPIVLGFSMGFQVALELYKRHRPLVGMLVSLAGPSGRVLSSFQGTDMFGHLLPILRATARFADDWTLRMWQKVVPSNALKWFGLQTQLNAQRIEIADFEFYLRQMARLSPELFVEMLHEAARHAGDDILARVRVPCLVIAGGQDRFVPLPTMRQVAFAIPGAEWVVIPEGSHALPAEFPSEIAEHLVRFADQHAPPP